jgi:hypothetical protein
LCLGGLIKHVANTEPGSTDRIACHWSGMRRGCRLGWEDVLAEGTSGPA